jgi:tRNA uridine 5-carboxymethylaminomethyl modification enzyme
LVLDMLVLKAAAAANLGSKPYNEPTEHCANVLQSCMGGIAKGQIVREIDALGGYSGIVSDRTAI